MTAVLGLQRSNSRVSVTSIASFTENANTRKAYKRFCQNLSEIGITEDMIDEKENEILDILRPQSTATSSQIGGSNIGDSDQGELPAAGCSNAETSLHMSSH